MDVLIAYFVVFLNEPVILEGFAKHMALLEQLLKKTKDKELLKTCLWGRQILRAVTGDKRADLCQEFSKNHLVVKVMTWILTSYISLGTIVEAYAEVKELYGGFPADVWGTHNEFLTKLLFEKVRLH